MAFITIKDLPQSDELDREAMLSIVGGARGGARPGAREASVPRAERIVDYPPGFGGLGELHRDRPVAVEAKGRRSGA